MKHSPPAGFILFRPSEEGKYVMMKLELQKSLQETHFHVFLNVLEAHVGRIDPIMLFSNRS